MLLLPTFQSPSIRYAAPRWYAYTPGLRGTIEVSASGYVEAKLAAAKKLNVHVQSVMVRPVPDLDITRLNRRA